MSREASRAVGGSSKARRDVSPASPRRSPSRSPRPTRHCSANRRCAKDEHPFASRVRSPRGEAHLSLRGRGRSRDPGLLGSPPELPASAGTAASPSATRVCRKHGPERTLPARMSHLRASVPNAAQRSHQLVARMSRLELVAAGGLGDLAGCREPGERGADRRAPEPGGGRDLAGRQRAAVPELGEDRGLGRSRRRACTGRGGRRGWPASPPPAALAPRLCASAAPDRSLRAGSSLG